MPLEHQDMHWGEVKLVGSDQQDLAGIQTTIHNFILILGSLIWCGEKQWGEGARERERKGNCLLLGEPIFTPAMDAGPSQLTWASWW